MIPRSAGAALAVPWSRGAAVALPATKTERMIRITHDISIAEDEVAFAFVRSPGPGGQNVNKVSTAAQLRFDIAACGALSDEVKQRLRSLAGRRVTEGGVLVIQARRYRSQGQNREDALGRFVDLVRRAATPPKVRRKTRPTAASRRRRLEDKRRRSAAKQRRRPVGGDDA